MTRPPMRERHFDYVLGPNQDGRLASIAPGAVVEKVRLVLDTDAPFQLRGRAVRCKYNGTPSQADLQGVQTRWAGPEDDYRQQIFIPEALQMANFGQCGNPGVVFPQITYPAGSYFEIDVYNAGAGAITNLTFILRGVKLFPWGAVADYKYPPRMAALSFAYPILVSQLGVSELRQNQIFTVKQDADFVWRAGQATAPFVTGGRTLAEVGIIFRDFDKKPYANDFVPMDVMFGSGAWPNTIPVGPTPTLLQPFGTGPAQPGLMYPEIYVPANHQLLYDIYRTDGSGGSNQAEDVYISLIGSKVFPR